MFWSVSSIIQPWQCLQWSLSEEMRWVRGFLSWCLQTGQMPSDCRQDFSGVSTFSFLFVLFSFNQKQHSSLGLSSRSLCALNSFFLLSCSYVFCNIIDLHEFAWCLLCIIKAENRKTAVMVVNPHLAFSQLWIHLGLCGRTKVKHPSATIPSLSL